MFSSGNHGIIYRDIWGFTENLQFLHPIPDRCAPIKQCMETRARRNFSDNSPILFMCYTGEIFLQILRFSALLKKLI